MKRTEPEEALQLLEKKTSCNRPFKPLKTLKFDIDLDRCIRQVSKRNLSVVMNTIHGNGTWVIAVEIDGYTGAAKSLIPAFNKAVRAWNKANRPTKRKKER